MSLRLFADHCVPNSVIAALRAAGHEVLILTDHLPAASDDPVVKDRLEHRWTRFSVSGHTAIGRFVNRFEVHPADRNNTH
jgi:nicotinamidase-related amidase